MLINRKILVFALIIFALKAQACSYCAPSLGGLSTGSPIFSMSPDTLPKKKIALGYTLQFLDAKQFNASDYSRFNRQGIHAHSYDSQLINSVNLIYGITDDLNLIVSYPYNAKYNLKYTYDGQIYPSGDSIGLGDMTVMAKYRFLQKNKFSMAALAGIRMPTGQTNERAKDGFTLAPDEQPGTGSWDPIMGILVNQKVKNLSLDANAVYKLSTIGSKDIIVGDVVNYNLAVSGIVGSREVLNQKLNLGWSMELNGIWRERIEFQGVKDDSHGGNVVFFTPGLRLAINDDLVTSFAVGIPVMETLNGKQPDTNVLLLFSMNYIF